MSSRHLLLELRACNRRQARCAACRCLSGPQSSTCGFVKRMSKGEWCMSWIWSRGRGRQRGLGRINWNMCFISIHVCLQSHVFVSARAGRWWQGGGGGRARGSDLQNSVWLLFQAAKGRLKKNAANCFITPLRPRHGAVCWKKGGTAGWATWLGCGWVSVAKRCEQHCALQRVSKRRLVSACLHRPKGTPQGHGDWRGREARAGGTGWSGLR